MDAGLKEKWLVALRSGEYKQAVGTLKLASRNGYCCLGVLAEVAGLKPNENVIEGVLTVGVAYNRIRDVAALPSVSTDRLIRMNDIEQVPFSEIADWVEANL